MKKKNKLIFAAFGICSIATTLVMTKMNDSFSSYMIGLANKDHSGHSGYHYQETDSTCNQKGHQEFWTCCNCHEYFLEKPTTGTYIDRGKQGAFSGEIPTEVLKDYTSHNYNYVLPTDHVGLKTGTCTVCGEVHQDVMNEGDADFKRGTDQLNLYNCGRDAVKPSWASTTFSENDFGWCWSTGSGYTRGLKMPWVDYTIYDSVYFGWKVNSTSSKLVSFYLNEDNDLLASKNNGNNNSGYFKVSYNISNSTLDVTCYNAFDGTSKTASINDEEIAKGKKSLTINLSSTLTYTYFSLNTFILNHEHSEEEMANVNVIGYKSEPCSLCGAEIKTIEKMLTSDITLGTKGYGAYITPNNDGDCLLMLESGKIKYRFAESGKSNLSYEIGLAKVDYRLYHDVTFDFENAGNSWYKIGFNEANSAQVVPTTGTTLNVKMESAEKYIATLSIPTTSGTPITISNSITDLDIISGKKNMTLYVIDPYGNPNRYLINTGITLNAQANKFDDVTSLSVTSEKATFEYATKDSEIDLVVKGIKKDGQEITLNKEDYVLSKENIALEQEGDHSIYVQLAERPALKTEFNYTITPKNSFKLLFIGNSFSQNTSQRIPMLASQLGIDCEVVNMYVGGCTINTHYSYITNDTAKYQKEVYDVNGTYKATQSVTLSEVIPSENWDYISIQQASHESGLIEKYSNVYNLTNKVRSLMNEESKESTKLIFNMTWAYQQDIATKTPSYADAFANYGSDQMKMYNSIVSCVSGLDRNVFDIVIPNGTTVQNMRTSYLGDTLNYQDGFHFYNEYNYALAATTIRSLTGKDISSLAMSTTEGYKKVAIEAAINAHENPYKVTNSSYKEETQVFNPDDYVEATIEWNDGKYYHCVENLPAYKYSWANSFSCTQIFTRETLPVGAIIYVHPDYRYRKENWVSLTEKTPSRNGNTDTKYTIVDKAWWGTYQYIGFNVSLGDGNSAIVDMDYESCHQGFKIYIPKTK